MKKNRKTCPEDIRLSHSAVSRSGLSNRSVEALAEGYVIGVDGGGTKTVAALSDLKGKILQTSKTGSSNLRNVGLNVAISHISEAILKVIKGVKREEIYSIFIALATIEEEFKPEIRKIKKAISQTLNFKGRIEIVSDQIVAFKAGANKKDGIVLISGTGCVIHGWRGKREMKVGGWGWLNDEGSGFWVGQKGYQAIFKDLDGRGQKTKITKLLFKEWKLKDKEELMKKTYGKDSIRTVSLISKIVDDASKRGDEVAKSIMEKAGKELALSAISVIKKLNFQNQKFSIVLVGRMFKSKIVLDRVQKVIKKFAPKVQFIRPKREPVRGAVKLAIEEIQYGSIKS